MDNTVLFFLVGIFVVGLLMLGYFARGNGALMVIAILIGVLLAMVAFFGGYLGETPK
ncbi:hypothetical protein [Ruegeria arenilitoris]|uniref:hypothetical protein n=1 Tax=Ruegeria arenilitoris TaxID=1173585 RepID=UPI00147E2D28|nr:hypothetical protein [Ruegeria arenilitoris]